MSLGATETILNRMEAALNADGDFPVRARVVSELRRLVSDPNTPVDKIVETILSEPSLGTRILHLVNSVIYQRAQPVVTVSQAVMQLGMRALCDLCAGFMLMQRFSPSAQKGGVFADNVKRSILCSVMSSSLVVEHGKAEDVEQAYLAGTFFSIGPLLLAYYFPQVLESAEKRAQLRKQSLTQSVTETIGIAPAGLSLGVVESLAIPQYYRDLLLEIYDYYINDTDCPPQKVRSIANLVSVASRLADAIVDSKSAAELQNALASIAKRAGLSVPQIETVLTGLPETFKQQCKMIEMGFLSLPDCLLEHLKGEVENEPAEASGSAQFGFYLDEIREAIANKETLSSIITTAMEALAFGQNFDRVLLLVVDENEEALVGKMALGRPFNVDLKDIRRDFADLSAPDFPDVRALIDGSVEVFGDPIFKEGWPFACVPVRSSDRGTAIIYADVLSHDPKIAKPLDSGTRLALNMLAELLDQASSQS